MVRSVVTEFVSLGSLPEESASEEIISHCQGLLSRIEAPVTDDEARLLVRCFGCDDSYGLAWTLLHLIETAPGGAPLDLPPVESDNEWLRRLWTRSRR
jgi:hypothetical protein